MFKLRSFSSRIVFSSLVFLPLALGFSAFMLDRAYQKSVLLAEQEALRAQMYSLLGATDPAEQSLSPPSGLSDPRFNTPESGLYAFISDNNNTIIWQSDSIQLSPWRDVINLESYAPRLSPGEHYFVESSLNKQDHFFYSLGTVWDIDQEETFFQFNVIHTKKDIQNELNSYRQILLFWLIGLSLLLISIQAVVMRWGLAPLKSLAKDIEKIESGALPQITGQYPREITPITNNINLLLKSEKTQREKYKNTLGDLAHSLKTPLAVIRAELTKLHTNDHSNAIDEQVERMAAIVNHQLNRATSNLKKTYQTEIDASLLIARILAALQKVYQHKNITFENNVSQPHWVMAEEDDLMEIFGNIIENACKYGHTQVSVSSFIAHDMIQFFIEDDGDGISNELKAVALNRGARLDTSKPGQGIGLTVAMDILSSYNGGLFIKNSSLGGANFVITFPK